MRSWRGNPWAVLLTVALGFFMTLLDLTIVNIALPNLIDDFDASLDTALWIVNAYALALATLLITAGRLGDLKGPRTLYVLGVLLFTAASLACALSQNGAELIAARAVQGIGAALLVPQTMTLIMATFPADRRGTALGVWGAVGGVATIAGPTLGGFLVHTLDWRWIFLVNVPIGVIVLILSFITIPDMRPGRSHQFDLTGVALATAALFCIAFALNEGERFDWSGGIWTLLAGGVVLLGVFVWHQKSRQSGEPLVPFALFRARNFAVMTVIASIIAFALIGLMVPLNLYLQSGLGMSALRAGLVMAPSSAATLLISPVAGKLSDRIGGKWLLLFGLLTFAIGLYLTGAVAETDSQWHTFLLPMIVVGLGAGCLMAPMATEAMRHVPPQLAGAASGINNTVRQIGSVVGAAAVGALMQNRLAANLPDEVARQAATLPAEHRKAFLEGFRSAAEGGVQAGGGRSDAVHVVVAHLPSAVLAQATRVAESVFGHSFLSMMRSVFWLPVGLLIVGALVCLTVRGRDSATPAPAAPRPEPASH
ncbi:DHA2 family efflux MFS transporter permease subunit [Streptomyces sp. NPDC052051]|uniref:DHA2 family efflux MFS transporter permease subunit n=1 Tax=Streptomyces sp. NPDC052051 TaxID=3154649 RepID=UPI00341F02D9